MLMLSGGLLLLLSNDGPSYWTIAGTISGLLFGSVGTWVLVTKWVQRTAWYTLWRYNSKAKRWFRIKSLDRTVTLWPNDPALRFDIVIRETTNVRHLHFDFQEFDPDRPSKFYSVHRVRFIDPAQPINRVFQVRERHHVCRPVEALQTWEGYLAVNVREESPDVSGEHWQRAKLRIRNGSSLCHRKRH
jgi:hypothetical protein